MKSWRNLIVCFAVFGLFFLGFDLYLKGQITNHYNDEINDDYGVIAKDQSVALQQTSLNRGDLVIFGTSELASYVRQNPRSFFPNKQLPYQPNIIGRAGVLSLEHTLNVSSLDFAKNKKVVYLVSFSWFTYPTVDSDSFYANFSKIKFYRYMTDRSVPKEDKIYVASRVGYLTNNYNNKRDLDAFVYGSLCGKFPSAFGAIQTAAYPYLTFEKAMLGVRDKARALVYMKQQKPSGPKKLKNIDWDSEYSSAQVEGKNSIHDKRFYFDDNFVKYMSDKIDSQKNYQANLDLYSSQEYQDYNLFLRTCKRKNIKPLVIIQSVNGWYYDYVGIDKSKREAIYQKLADMAEGYGFTACNLKDLEYTPYAYSDAWHLAWKGWLYVDKEIADYFDQNN